MKRSKKLSMRGRETMFRCNWFGVPLFLGREIVVPSICSLCGGVFPTEELIDGVCLQCYNEIELEAAEVYSEEAWFEDEEPF